MSTSPLGWGPRKRNYERQAITGHLKDKSEDSNKHEETKKKLDVFRSTLELQKTGQLPDTASQNSSESDQFKSTELQRRLVEDQRRHRETEAEEFEKAVQKRQDLQEDRHEREDVSSIDYEINSRKLDHMNRELGAIDKRIRKPSIRDF